MGKTKTMPVEDSTGSTATYALSIAIQCSQMCQPIFEQPSARYGQPLIITMCLWHQHWQRSYLSFIIGR